MTLKREQRWRWRCPPSTAALHFIHATWPSGLELISEDLSPEGDQLKRLIISIPHRALVEVRCFVERSDTTVEVHIDDQLPRRHRPLIKSYLEHVTRSAREAGHVRRQMGFYSDRGRLQHDHEGGRTDDIEPG